MISNNIQNQLDKKSKFKLNLQSNNRSIYKGPNSNSSHNGGYKTSILKSSFQKYIRRGLFEKALYFIIQMYLFNVKHVRTNLLNRLIIITTEDVSIGEWRRLIKGFELIEIIKNKKIDDPTIDDCYELVYLTWLLCSGKKSRLGSHYLNCFYKNLQKENSQNKFKDYFPLDTSFKSMDFSDYLKKEMIKSHEERLKIFNFITKLSDDGLYKKITSLKISHNQLLSSCISILLNRYKTLKHMERPRYLHHALLLIIFEDKIDWNEEYNQIVPNDIYLKEVFEKVLSQINNNEIIVPDEYCLDMHTKSKNRTDEDKHKFRIEGAFVENEDERFLYKVYKEYYERFYSSKESNKEKNLNIAESKDMLLNKKRGKGKNTPQNEVHENIFKMLSLLVPIRKIDNTHHSTISQAASAQLLTSNHKKQVKVFEDNVLKGIYSIGDIRLFRNIINSEMIGILEEELKISPNMKSHIKIDSLIEVDINNKHTDTIKNKGYYIEYKNIGDLSKGIVSIKSSKIQSNEKIYDRSTYVRRVSELITDKKSISEFEENIFKASFTHLYLRRLLIIDNNKKGNFENPKQIIIGIDMEDSRKEEEYTLFQIDLIDFISKGKGKIENRKMLIDTIREIMRKYLFDYKNISFNSIFSQGPYKNLIKYEYLFEIIKNDMNKRIENWLNMTV